MAPTHNAVAVQSVQFDAQFAQRTAVLLGSLQPRLKPEQAVAELLACLAKEKVDRESRGLNHWNAHAPRFLGGLVRQARNEKRRRHQEAETYFRAKRREILSYARAVVGDAAAAEVVASETYRELLEGGTDASHFFMALAGNARNYLARQAYQREKFTSWEETVGSEGSYPEGMDKEEGNIQAFDLHSSRHEDQDPLDILIAREEEQERQKLIASAKKDPRWRYIKTRDWAAPLRENVRN